MERKIAFEYSSPDLDVQEIRTVHVLCQSGDTERYHEGNTDEWFNA